MIIVSSIFILCMTYHLSSRAIAAERRIISADEDIDGDGWSPPEDCDEGNPDIHPGAVEIPDNGVDENCDGSDAQTCYADADGDGYGDPYISFYSVDADCDDPGEAYSGTDCDDSNDSIHPGAAEEPDDGIDSDCDGSDGTITAIENASWSAIKALCRL